MVVLIFDRSRYIPERLVSLISEAREGTICYKAGTYEEAALLLKECIPHAVLLDQDFPGDNAFELLTIIRQANENAKIIIMFTIADNHKLTLYKEHGADFLFDKYHEFEKIPPAIVGIP